MNRPEWFADTGYWIALANAGDSLHARARTLSRSLTTRLVTTDAVLFEVGDALHAGRLRALAVALIEDVRNDRDVVVVSIDDLLFERGLALFATRPDRERGLTDCISFVVMGERGISEALAYDQHFVQAGFGALLREP
jgi:predicted nucleic acid-binding protein